MTWGPWIEHDGKGCPCMGQQVQARYCVDAQTLRTSPRQDTFIAEGGGSWTWGRLDDRKTWSPKAPGKWFPITHYRIRYPDALTTLREIAANPDRELAAAQ